MKKFLHKILLVANIIFVAALLISYSASFINPEIFVMPALFGLAYPYLLLANICFVLIWLSFLKWEMFISLVVILLGFNHFSNFIQLKKPDDTNEGTFKIICYNVRLFNTYEKNNPESSEKVLSFLKDQQADILCLQELYINNEHNESYLKRSLSNNYHVHSKFLSRDKNRYYGIATYSKYPIIDKGEIIHPESASLTIYSDIVIAPDTFRVFNNHLQSFKLKSMERSFIEEIVTINDKSSRNDVKQLSLSLRNGFVQRSQQAISVKEAINQSPYPVIVLGDFNDTPVSYSYRTLRKGLQDAFVNSGYGAGFSYKGSYPANRIDYILYSNKLQSKRFDIFKIKYSDHYPVCAYFNIVQ